MYALIIAIHAIFVWVAHLLGYRIFEWVFLLLGCFFLFYFSPLFFLDQEEKKSEKNIASLGEFFTRFSLKESIILPLSFFYIGLYLLFFSIFWSRESFIFIHSAIVIGLYLLFFGYTLAFYWKHDTYFESLRFQSVFTLVTTLLLLLYWWYNDVMNPSLLLLLIFLWVISSVFLLSYTKKESTLFITLLLLSFYAIVSLLSSIFFWEMSLTWVITVFFIFSLLVFEYFPKIPIFSLYSEIIRRISLAITLMLVSVLIFLVFRSMETLAILCLVWAVLFFLSIHIRFTNYITYVWALVLIFFLYSMIFSGLIAAGAPFPTFLFVFFLSVLLLSMSYLIEEAHDYDFIILHYSSIAFSSIASIYVIFFVSWGDDILFMLALCVFGIALLLFLSYFRFRNHKHA